jgi:hypothetical protein
MRKLAFALALTLGGGFAAQAWACDCTKKTAKKQCACAHGTCPGSCPKDADKTAPAPDKPQQPDKK